MARRGKQQVLAIAIAGACAALGGCASVEYAPMSEQNGIGYRDWQNADGSHTILVTLPQYSDPATSHAFWDRRATEICGHTDYHKNIFRAERPTVYYDNYGGRPGGYILEGYLRCDRAEASSADAQPAAEPAPN